MIRPMSVVAMLLICGSSAAELSDISNYRLYSPTFASSGQPTERQLEQAEEAGFERIVYIAYSDHKNSLDNEDRVVKGLGMEYLHIPVEWNEPTKSDFYLFAGAMQKAPQKKTLLHCQVNYRASAFSFLYRVLYEDVSVAEAKSDMNAIWTPNETWTRLILEVLRENGKSDECDSCDWTPTAH